MLKEQFKKKRPRLLSGLLTFSTNKKKKERIKNFDVIVLYKPLLKGNKIIDTKLTDYGTSNICKI